MRHHHGEREAQEDPVHRDVIAGLIGHQPTDGQHSPGRMPVSYELENKWQAWLRGGTLASEMESAALYIVCQSLGARAACILNTIWNQERRARGLDDRESHDTLRGIRVAVEAIRRHILAGRA